MDERVDDLAVRGIHVAAISSDSAEAAAQLIPFARPRIDDIVGAIDYVIKSDYPPLGKIINASDLEALQ